jgi:predicted RNase H-like HicB family nuclease
MDYIVVIERADDDSFSVYVPDLPGCISCGDTPDEALEMIAEAIRGHIEVLKEHGEPIPPPRSTAHVLHAA